MSVFSRTSRRVLLAAAVLSTCLLPAAALAGPAAAAPRGAAPAATAVPLPSSMASAGDSITRAFDVGWCCVLSDSPQYSWSTGTSTGGSHYQRILAANPAISGQAYNDAKTGAKMVDLAGQLATAAGQGAQYVTVLMGANDVCTSSRSTMTPTATFKAQFQQALANFTAAAPGARVFVSSIPDIYQLWATLHTNSTARWAWANYGICQSMLASTATDADRAAVAAQEQADNQALADVCALFAQCKWDGLATYNFKFPAGDVSTVDYFHPNTTGQKDLAAKTWAAGYWPTV